ncbi:hypothetical protein [Paralcaligenes ureilyticus]|uniref:Uncharacterized protein n=1 Tax=Paralcaligenes ureilyticus TaxID=627131 RepID=A0A4R3MBS7_9BURK|nr:hypothetical protein [Paralcaligenes ureilyticus]TCT10233.1 hypothetical protein EDC26_102189 [Paralcaligenes ureilyticus]
MLKTKFCLIVASVAVMSCFALGAQARGGGGGGGGGVGGGAGVGGGHGGGHGGIGSEAGGVSGSHMSSHGIANTNSVHSLDRDKGLQRAGDRSHQHARASRATANSGKHKALGLAK